MKASPASSSTAKRKQSEPIGRLRKLDRRQVRARFERRFTARRMAEEYVSHYTALAGGTPRQVARQP